MREIKFRVWDKEMKHMEYNFLGTSKFDGKREYRLIYQANSLEVSHMSGMIYDPMYYEIMQSTGLRDKNGKEINEGDIIELISPAIGKGEQFLVFWLDIRGRFQTRRLRDNSEYQEILSNAPIMNNYKIIGNRFDNPELMEIPK